MVLFQLGGAMTRKFSLAFAYTETCKSENFQKQNKSKKIKAWCVIFRVEPISANC